MDDNSTCFLPIRILVIKLLVGWRIIIKGPFSLISPSHPNFFGSSQAGVIDPKKKYSVHFSRVGVKIELDREEDSLDERPLWSTLDPTWCVFILTDGSAFETQPLRTFCGGSQEPLERKDVLP